VIDSLVYFAQQQPPWWIWPVAIIAVIIGLLRGGSSGASTPQRGDVNPSPPIDPFAHARGSGPTVKHVDNLARRP